MKGRKKSDNYDKTRRGPGLNDLRENPFLPAGQNRISSDKARAARVTAKATEGTFSIVSLKEGAETLMAAMGLPLRSNTADPTQRKPCSVSSLSSAYPRSRMDLNSAFSSVGVVIVFGVKRRKSQL